MVHLFETVVTQNDDEIDHTTRSKIASNVDSESTCRAKVTFLPLSAERDFTSTHRDKYRDALRAAFISCR